MNQYLQASFLETQMIKPTMLTYNKEADTAFITIDEASAMRADEWLDNIIWLLEAEELDIELLQGLR